jgi:hypothetical protein
MKAMPVAVVGGVVAALVLPVLAVAAIAGSLIPTATSAAACADPVAGRSAGWRPPLLGRYLVSSRFGNRYHPVLHTTRLHTGIDLVATGPRTVVAAARGTVLTRGYHRAYGNQVVIDHGGGLRTRYAHLAGPSPVTADQTVAPGHRLGVQGATGYVTGPHLHFEVIRHGRPINPAPFMTAHHAPLTGAATHRPTTAPATDRGQGPTARSGAGPSRVTATRADGQRVTLTGAQLTNAATIARVGHQVHAGRRGTLIALMAALQESTLRNLNSGDRDSIGLFQQRAGWGTPAQRHTPRHAARAFFGGPTGPNAGHPPGLLDQPRWQHLPLGAAAQAVQVSAFPRAYTPWAPVAHALLARVAGAVPAACVDAAAGTAAATPHPRAPGTPGTRRPEVTPWAA